MRFYYKILLLSFVLIIIVPSICLGGNVRIFGSLKDFRSAKTELVWTGISSEIFNDYKINIEANSDGNFDITTDLREPGYYTLGKNIIYLKPGDVIELHPNSTSSKSVFKGVGSEFDDYLKGCGWQEGTQIISIGDKRSFSEIKHITDSIVNNRISALMNLKLGNNVNNMEIARLKAEQISLYFNYFVYAMFIQKGDNDSVKLAKKRNYFESVENYVYPLLKDI